MKEILSDFFWAIQAFFIVFITMVIAFVEKKIYKKLLPRLKKTAQVWDDAAIEALHVPLQCIIWLAGITLAIQVSASYTQNDYLVNWVLPIRTVGIGILLIWFLVRFIHQIEINILDSTKRSKWDETSLRAITQILRASVLLTGILILLQTMGIPVSGVLAFGGIGGIAIGFAAKDLLANFFGGLMLFLDRPFKIGDEIKCIEKPYEGIVENIGWRLTRLRTYERRPLFIPNSTFSTIAIENLTRMSNRRVKDRFSIKYKDATKIPQIIEDIEQMLANHEEIDSSKLVTVDLVTFGDHSLDIEIYAFTKSTGFRAYRKAQQDIFLQILTICEKYEAKIAIPQMIVEMEKE